MKQLTQQNVHSKIGETREVCQKKNKHYKENIDINGVLAEGRELLYSHLYTSQKVQ